MNDQRQLRLRGAPIIHDTIDNETIAINQLSGQYYSLEGAAALVWQVLAVGATRDTIVDVLEQHYDADRSTLAAAVDGLLTELTAEELVVEVDPAGEAGDRAPNGTARTDPPPPAARPPFTGLLLQRYSDLETLLLADPIHEVDESGWPTPVPREG